MLELDFYIAPKSISQQYLQMAVGTFLIWFYLELIFNNNKNLPLGGQLSGASQKQFSSGSLAKSPMLTV